MSGETGKTHDLEGWISWCVSCILSDPMYGRDSLTISFDERYPSVPHRRRWATGGSSPTSTGRWPRTPHTIRRASLSFGSLAGARWPLSRRTRRFTRWRWTTWSPNWRRPTYPVPPPSPLRPPTSRSSCCYLGWAKNGHLNTHFRFILYSYTQTYKRKHLWIFVWKTNIKFN